MDKTFVNRAQTFFVMWKHIREVVRFIHFASNGYFGKEAKFHLRIF